MAVFEYTSVTRQVKAYWRKRYHVERRSDRIKATDNTCDGIWNYVDWLVQKSWAAGRDNIRRGVSSDLLHLWKRHGERINSVSGRYKYIRHNRKGLLTEQNAILQLPLAANDPSLTYTFSWTYSSSLLFRCRFNNFLLWRIFRCFGNAGCLAIWVFLVIH